jgi:hypothetical protein
MSNPVIAVLLKISFETAAGAQVRIGLAAGDSEHCLAMPGDVEPDCTPGDYREGGG